MDSLKVQHDAIFSIKNDENANDDYDDILKVVNETLQDLTNISGRLSYAFPPFIYSEVIRCIINICLSFFFYCRRLNCKFCCCITD